MTVTVIAVLLTVGIGRGGDEAASLRAAIEGEESYVPPWQAAEEAQMVLYGVEREEVIELEASDAANVLLIDSLPRVNGGEARKRQSRHAAAERRALRRQRDPQGNFRALKVVYRRTKQSTVRVHIMASAKSNDLLETLQIRQLQAANASHSIIQVSPPSSSSSSSTSEDGTRPLLQPAQFAVVMVVYLPAPFRAVCDGHRMACACNPVGAAAATSTACPFVGVRGGGGGGRKRKRLSRELHSLLVPAAADSGSDTELVTKYDVAEPVVDIFDRLGGAPDNVDMVEFNVNMHDFVYYSESAYYTNQLIDMHAAYDVPVSIFFNDNVFQKYLAGHGSNANATAVNVKVKLYDWVALGSHFRPPHAGQGTLAKYDYPDNTSWVFDVTGMLDMDRDVMLAECAKYESNALNLKRGGYTSVTSRDGDVNLSSKGDGALTRGALAGTAAAPTGGSLKFIEFFGKNVTVVGGNWPSGAKQAWSRFFNESCGATFAVQHSKNAIALGAELNDWLNAAPASYEFPGGWHSLAPRGCVSTFNTTAADATAAEVFDAYVYGDGSGDDGGALTPGNKNYIGFKIHENNIYATNTPWTPVYYHNSNKTDLREPPWQAGEDEVMSVPPPDLREPAEVACLLDWYEESLEVVADLAEEGDVVLGNADTWKAWL